MEATPQVHITLMLLGQYVLQEQYDPLLWTSFAISIFSVAFGIAKLLKNGPIKTVRKDGKIGGYGTPGFILLMVVVAGNMTGKATWMAILIGFIVGNAQRLSVIWIWALTCLLPQFLLVRLQNNCLFLSANICYQKKWIFIFKNSPRSFALLLLLQS